MSSITERAMLVDLTITQWTAAKHDRTVSQEVAELHGSDASMGRYHKLLIGREALETLRQVASAAGQEHRRRTLPWLDNGARMLSAEGYFGYTEVMRQFEAQWQPALDAFVRDYPDYMDQARRRLNGLFQPEDYPPAHRIRERFGFGYSVLPLPSELDFRVELGELETARVRASICDQVNAALDAAMRDVWERIQAVVGHMAERLRAYSVTPDGPTGVFRDSLVENVRELVGLLPTLNVTGNAAIAQLTERMRAELCSYTPRTLRNSKAARDRTAAAAEAILQQVEAVAA